jgi:hypothetical protein
MLHAALGDTVCAGTQPRFGVMLVQDDKVHVKKCRGPGNGAQVMIVANLVKHQACLAFMRPKIQVFPGQRLNSRLNYHSHHSLVVNAFAYTFQFLICAYFVGTFTLRKLLTNSGKGF